MAKKTTRKRKVKEHPSFFKTVGDLLADERFKIIIGLVFVFFAAFLALAFVSYLFTWKSDQDIVERGWVEMATSSAKVENWASKLGAFLSHVFIHDWFGIASFAFIFVIVLIGFRLMKIKLLDLGKSLKYTILGVIWLSITLGFFLGDDYFFLGGAHGVFLSKWLTSMIGSFGTFFLILLSVFTFIIFTFDNSLIWLKNSFESIPKSSFRIPTIKIKSPKLKTESNTIEEASKKEEGKTKLNGLGTENEEFGTGVKSQTEKDEELKGVVNKKEFFLQDDGKEVLANKGLDMEIENTISKQEEETVEIAPELGFETVKANTDEQIKTTDSGMAILVEKNEDIQQENVEIVLEDYDPKLELSRYHTPPIDLLEDHRSQNSEVSNEELISNKNRIVETLKNYKIEIQKIKATIGPTITLYEIIPAPGVRISKIKNLEDDIALSLAAMGIRIIAPMPGRGTVGIEVPNQKPEIVSMRSVITSKKFQESKYELPIALGKTISNETYVGDLTKMPHLLVAGATGQGKSVGLNAILASMLYKKHPSQVKFVLVDPKKVELTLYEKLERHFLAALPDADEPIITDNQKVVHTLSSLNVEMDNRYSLLKKAMVRNIKEYNTKFIARKLNPEKGHRYLPYIVLVIDEFADLIMTAGKEVEMPIARLAQLARAIGIHLIVATQRPSTNIITGVIKANFPTRLAFKVASMVDSRTILDSPGANQLIGRGDMLITQGSDLIRLQCAFIDTPELDKITDFIGSQQGYPMPYLLPEYEGSEGDEGGESVDLAKRDDLFEDAARLVVAHQQGSTSLIQRKMSIGYNRAGRIMDQLEAAGIVGPFEGSKARSVLYHDERSLEEYLSTF